MSLQRSLAGIFPLFFLLAMGLQATTYYVAIGGNDSNPGTQNAPFRHLSRGAAQAFAGDTVIVEDGTYDNEGQISPNYVVNLYNSGTPSAPITFMAEHRGAAILDGGLTNTSFCDGAYAYFNLGYTSYIVIQGFNIQHSCVDAIHNNDTAHHITLRQNEIHHIANMVITDEWGRTATGCPQASHDIAIDSNSFHDIGRSNGSFTSSLDHALYMSCSNLTITNNTFYNQLRGWDIQLSEGSNNVVIANNTFASHNPGQNGQIMVWNSHNNLVMRNNIFYNPPGYAVTSYTASVSNCQIDHNLISGSAGLYGGNGCATSSNRLGSDPVFVSASGHNYQLESSSPAIDAGVTISSITHDFLGTYRPQGAGYDIGAYEYASGTTTLPPPPPPPTPQPPSSNGLAASWNFSEGSGTTVADSSGNQNTGTLVGAPAWVSGTYGTALSFNGVNDYVDVNESASLEQSNALTVALWVLVNPTSGDPRMVAKSFSWDIKLNGSALRPQFSSAGKYAMLNYSLPPGTWQHVAFTFTSAGGVTGYVNGVATPFAQNTFSGGETLPVMSYGLLIGTDADKQYFAKGLMNDIRIYDRALSSAEVQALYSDARH